MHVGRPHSGVSGWPARCRRDDGRQQRPGQSDPVEPVLGLAAGRFRPGLITSYQTKPPWAKTTSRSVCSGSTAASARWRSTRASAPRLAHSSSITKASSTSPAGRGPCASRSAATSAAAMPPFMSLVPRPYIRPVSDATARTGAEGRPPRRCGRTASASARRPYRQPSHHVGAAGSGVPDVHLEARQLHPSASSRATAASPAPSRTSVGFVESAAHQLGEQLVDVAHGAPAGAAHDQLGGQAQPPRRAGVAADPGQQPLAGHPAQIGNRMRDDGQRRVDQRASSRGRRSRPAPGRAGSAAAARGRPAARRGS